MATVADITTKLADLKISIDTLAAAIVAHPAPVATQADLDTIAARIDEAATALAAIPPQ